MNEPSIAADADDVLDFSDIVLITMSSAATTGRVMAASICSCGNLVAPAMRSARRTVTDDRCAAAARPEQLGRRIYRRVLRVIEKLLAA